MRWRIGDRTFDRTTRRVTGADERKLNYRQGRLLEFLIVNYGKAYKDDQLKKVVWEGKDAESTIHKYISVLRDALGEEGESLEERKRIIDTDPYRLMIQPEPITDGELPSTKGTAFNAHDISGPEESKVSSPASNPEFDLIVDGMIINSVSELIYDDPETAGIRNICSASYERSLADLAFAAVYAIRLVTGKDFGPSLTTPDQPGRELAARLGEICEQRAYPAKITDGHLLRDEKTRQGIRDDMRRFSQCMANSRASHFFRDYMVREATKHLGTDLRLFQDDIAPEDYVFNVKRPYYTNRELQEGLGAATDVLVSFLPKTPPNSTDKYATNALREFATRNVLTHITIMWEGEEYAGGIGSRRAPHVLRSLVTMKRSKDRGGTQHQEIVRDLVVEHALTTALRSRQEKNRHNIVGVLLNLRDDYPFKQIRALLNEQHLILMEPDPRKEQAARTVLKQLKALTASTPMASDKVHLAHDTAIRAVGGTSAGEYQHELYRVFPELAPTRG